MQFHGYRQTPRRDFHEPTSAPPGLSPSAGLRYFTLLSPRSAVLRRLPYAPPYSTPPLRPQPGEHLVGRSGMDGVSRLNERVDRSSRPFHPSPSLLGLYTRPVCIAPLLVIPPTRARRPSANPLEKLCQSRKYYHTYGTSFTSRWSRSDASRRCIPRWFYVQTSYKISRRCRLPSRFASCPPVVRFLARCVPVSYNY